jgi:hypothetical protein
LVGTALHFLIGIHSRWARALQTLQMHHREAAKYLTIAEGWWGQQTPDGDLLDLLPFDLPKLQLLSRLSREQLSAFCASFPCRDMARDTLRTAILETCSEEAERGDEAPPLAPADDHEEDE